MFATRFNGQSLQDLYSNSNVLKRFAASTVFGRQIVCVAEYWYSQKCKELVYDQKADTCVQNFINEYHGSNYDEYEAWCAIFPWFIMRETAAALGCSHRYPNIDEKVYDPNEKVYKQVLGGAARTYWLAKERYQTDTTPAAGSVFYRKSDSAKASGHMGVVILVDSANSRFYSIEGNITIDNTGGKKTDGIGMWEYSFSEITSRSFQFIHTELNPCSATETVIYKGQNCKAEVNKDVIVEKKTTTTTPPPPGFEEAKEKTLILTSKKKSGETDTEYQERIKREKKKECIEIVLTVPSTSRIQHASMLWTESSNSGLRIGADITGAAGSGYSDAERNGSGLWFYGSNKNPERPSGFAMLRGTTGNIYYLLDTGSGPSRTVYENLLKNLDGGIVEIRFRGENSSLGKARQFAGLATTTTTTPAAKVNGNPIFYSASDGVDIWGTSGFSSTTNIKIPDFIKGLDASSKYQTSQPIVIILDTYTPVDPVASLFDVIFTLASITATFVGIPPVLGQAIAGTKELARMIRSGNYTVETLLNSFKSVAALLAPDFVKKTEEELNGLKGAASTYLSDAGVAVDKILPKIGGLAVSQAYSEISQKIGLAASEIEKVFKYYDPTSATLGTILPNLLNIQSGASLSGVGKTVYNLSNMLLLDRLGRRIKSGYLKSDIADNRAITEVPLLSDVFISGVANTVLPAITGIDEIVPAIFKSKYQSIITSATSKDKAIDVIAGLTGAMFGYNSHSNVYDEITISSLAYKANLLKGTGIPFVLPPSISEDKEECYKYILEQEVPDVPIIHCPKGWDWDASLRKCVNLTVKEGGNGKSTEKYIYEAGKDGSDTSSTIYKDGKDGSNTSSTIYKDGSDGSSSSTIIKKDGDTPPPTIKIPQCIEIINGKYYFNLKWREKVSTISTVAKNPVSTSGSTGTANSNPITVNPVLNPVEKVISTLTAPNTPVLTSPTVNQASTTQPQTANTAAAASQAAQQPVSNQAAAIKPTTAPVLQLPTGTLPGVSPIQTPGAFIPEQSIKPVSSNVVTPGSKVDLKLNPQQSINPQYSMAPSVMLSDDAIYPAKVVNLATSAEKWYAYINNEWVELVNCNPVKIPDTPPAIIKIPQCIEIIDSKYYFTYRGQRLPVQVLNLGKTDEIWLVRYNNSDYPLKDCQIFTAQDVPPPEIKTPPVLPPIIEPPVEKLPVYPPYDNPVDTPPVYPPYKNSGETPPYETPKPEEPPTYFPPPTKEKEVPNRSPTGECTNCPKMVEKHEKVIYDYPNCDEHCCGDNC